MRNTETGEFELVVGNKQLLSAFFVIVLLCAVAFVMGYVLGENSRGSKGATEIASAAPVPVTAPEVRPQPAAPVQSPPASEAVQAAEPAAQQPAEAQPQPTTQPARELQQAAPPAKAAVTAAAATFPPPPNSGSFWQITATSNKDSAQDLLQTLQNKGFPASLRTDSNNLIHVLVGPYNDKQTFAKAKTELENAGMPTPNAT
jgi:cell division septation protein DedD